MKKKGSNQPFVVSLPQESRENAGKATIYTLPATPATRTIFRSRSIFQLAFMIMNRKYSQYESTHAHTYILDTDVNATYSCSKERCWGGYIASRESLSRDPSSVFTYICLPICCRRRRRFSCNDNVYRYACGHRLYIHTQFFLALLLAACRCICIIWKSRRDVAGTWSTCRATYNVYTWL